jgi:hypothetical protein
MAHDLIHIEILQSSDSPRKPVFGGTNIGLVQLKFGFDAVVSKLLNGCWLP